MRVSIAALAVASVNGNEENSSQLPLEKIHQHSRKLENISHETVTEVAKQVSELQNKVNILSKTLQNAVKSPAGPPKTLESLKKSLGSELPDHALSALPEPVQEMIKAGSTGSSEEKRKKIFDQMEGLTKTHGSSLKGRPPRGSEFYGGSPKKEGKEEEEEEQQQQAAHTINPLSGLYGSPSVGSGDQGGAPEVVKKMEKNLQALKAMTGNPDQLKTLSMENFPPFNATGKTELGGSSKPIEQLGYKKDGLEKEEPEKTKPENISSNHGGPTSLDQLFDDKKFQALDKKMEALDTGAKDYDANVAALEKKQNEYAKSEYGIEDFNGPTTNEDWDSHDYDPKAFQDQSIEESEGSDKPTGGK